jgi:hypothetical protein
LAFFINFTDYLLRSNVPRGRPPAARRIFWSWFGKILGGSKIGEMMMVNYGEG